MTPSLDLMLETIERALATSILPNAANAAAKEEASLAILFTRWIREVLDDVPAAERASYRDCRAALDAVTARLEARATSGAALDLIRESRAGLFAPDAVPPAEIRQATRRIKALLGRLLHTIRAEGDARLANEVRVRLYDLGLRELERERAFGRGSAMDPDWRSISSLADLSARQHSPKEANEMSDLTPLRAVQMYNDDVWGRHRRELIVELLANPLRRHHPGRTEVFTHDDMLKRYDNYFSKNREMRAVARRYVCEGAYVTLLWDIEMVANDGKVSTISGIEIFKVVDGKITDVWNPNAVVEQYPAGPWPSFNP